MINVEGLSKRYRLGPQRAAAYRTLRESLHEAVTAPLRRIRAELWNAPARLGFAPLYWCALARTRDSKRDYPTGVEA